MLEDLFGNTPATSQTWTITWPSDDALIEDGTPPRVEQILVTADGHLEVELSERVDAASLASVAVDGAGISWSETQGGRVFRSQSALPSGSHTVQLGSGVVDLAGLPLSGSVSESFTVAAGEARWVHRSPIAQEVDASTVDNPFGFKGLPLDEWTGFYYVRNRYYDPELGRFITPDPLGYVDGPSMYLFAMNDPVNYSDPMGLFCPECPRDIDWSREAYMRQKRFQEEVDIERALLESHFRAQGRTFEDFDQLNAATFDYFRSQGKRTEDAAFWAGLVIGDGLCDDGSVLCAGEEGWALAADGVEVMEGILQVSLVVFDPLAVAGPASQVSRGVTSAKRLPRFGAKGWRVPKGTTGPEIRAAYNVHRDRLRRYVTTMVERGAPAEHTARRAHLARRLNGMRHKAATPTVGRLMIYYRNRAPTWFPPLRFNQKWMKPKNFDSIYGPSIEHLRSQGKSWEQINESSVETSLEFNRAYRTPSVGPKS